MHDIKEIREKVRSMTLLVVDDEVEVLDASLEFMEKFFLQVDIAHNGDEAIVMYERNDGYDVVITDIVMPGMSGWELIKRLRAKGDHLFLGAMTGSDHKHEESPREYDILLTKPVELDMMLRLMESVARHKGS